MGIVIGLRAAAWVLTLGVRLLAHPVGRRLLAALALIAVCAGLVVLVFTTPEPAEPAEPESNGSQAAHAAPTTSARATTATPMRPATSPEEAAAAWYAHRKHLPRSRVRVLQRDHVNPRLVRVLVLADGGKGRLDTALLIVRRDGTDWRVDQ